MTNAPIGMIARNYMMDQISTISWALNKLNIHDHATGLSHHDLACVLSHFDDDEADIASFVHDRVRDLQALERSVRDNPHRNPYRWLGAWGYN